MTSSAPEGTVLEEIDLEDLENNLFSLKFYGAEIDDELLESLDKRGLLQPLVGWRHKPGKVEIISGTRRTLGLRKLGRKSAPVYVYTRPLTESEVKQLIIESNLYRVKSNELVTREYEQLRLLKAEAAQARMRSGKAALDGEKGDAATLTARQLGMSRRTAELRSAVLSEIDAAEAAGNTQRASELRDILNNKSAAAAHRAAFPQGNGSNGAAEQKPKRSLGKDKSGHPVPPHLIPIFKAQAEFNAAASKIASLKGDVRKLAKTKAGALIDVQDFEKKLDLARYAFALDMPQEVCKDCSGNGCGQCGKRGWRSQRECATSNTQAEAVAT
jgi:ParB-like chromosome segregation protein Spo0J